MRRGVIAAILTCLICSASAGASDKGSTLDVGTWFKGTNGAFVVYDVKRNTWARYNAKRCAERKSPFSTFKIPNSLIGLETGVVENADTLFKWRPELYEGDTSKPPFNTWAQDHTLRSAAKNSVVWYYQEIARKVGAPAYRKYLADFDYGNRKISGPVDRFWLRTPLAISPDEQVAFLTKLQAGKLPVSARSAEIVEDIFTNESGPGWRLVAKTGSGPVGDNLYLGWFVGYVEKGDEVYVFAMNMDGPTYDYIREHRVDVAKGVLRDRGILPAQ